VYAEQTPQLREQEELLAAELAAEDASRTASTARAEEVAR